MMHDTIREGTRGGQAEFRWSAVKEDKDRENYLGHSVNAPQGRWQSRKDIHWYARDKEETDADKLARERKEEIRRLKEAEEDALAVALGFAPTVRNPEGEGEGTGANNIKVEKTAKDLEIEALEKEQRLHEKAIKREQKEMRRAEKEERRKEKEERRAARKGRSRRHTRSPSDSTRRSPEPRSRRRDDDRHRSPDRSFRSRSRSPRRYDRDEISARASVKHEHGHPRHHDTRERQTDDRHRNSARGPERGLGDHRRISDHEVKKEVDDRR